MPETPTIDLRASSDPFRIWGTGDWHRGSAWHDATLFGAHLERAVAEGWHLFHIGDGLEMVTPSSRVALRGALAEQTLTPEQQRQDFVAILKRLRGGFVLPGNHEFRIDMATGLDFIKSITESAGSHMQPLFMPGRVRVLVGSQSYEFYIHHGEGPVVSPVTLFDRIQRDEEGLDAILAGHIHASTFDPAEVGSPCGDRIVLRLRTGHYLKPPRYALTRPIARRGARGSWLLTLSPAEHKIEATWLGTF